VEAEATPVEPRVDVNAQTADGRSRLHYTADRGHLEVAATLVQLAADVHAIIACADTRRGGAQSSAVRSTITGAPAAAASPATVRSIVSRFTRFRRACAIGLPAQPHKSELPKPRDENTVLLQG
jgi:hypothetical protein